MVHYIGVIDGLDDIWGVRFPDVDGCVSAGATPEAAIADATVSLRDVLTYKSAQGFAIPKASSLAEVLASAEVATGESTVMIPLLLDSGRTIRAQVTLDAGLLAAIDDEAHQQGVTRSAFMASAAREKIEARR